jgi:hypothetical protein
MNTAIEPLVARGWLGAVVALAAALAVGDAAGRGEAPEGDEVEPELADGVGPPQATTIAAIATDPMPRSHPIVKRYAHIRPADRAPDISPTHRFRTSGAQAQPMASPEGLPFA